MELLFTVGGNAKWYNRYEKQHGDSSKNLKLEVPYNLAIPSLSVYSKELKSGY